MQSTMDILSGKVMITNSLSNSSCKLHWYTFKQKILRVWCKETSCFPLCHWICVDSRILLILNYSYSEAWRPGFKTWLHYILILSMWFNMANLLRLLFLNVPKKIITSALLTHNIFEEQKHNETSLQSLIYSLNIWY